METLIGIGKFVMDHGNEILVAVEGMLMGVIGICLLIPGDQPEKALQAIVDFLKKFSKKPNS
jgi:hypothetical protein